MLINFETIIVVTAASVPVFYNALISMQTSKIKYYHLVGVETRQYLPYISERVDFQPLKSHFWVKD